MPYQSPLTPLASIVSVKLSFALLSPSAEALSSSKVLNVELTKNDQLVLMRKLYVGILIVVAVTVLLVTSPLNLQPVWGCTEVTKYNFSPPAPYSANGGFLGLYVCQPDFRLFVSNCFSDGGSTCETTPTYVVLCEGSAGVVENYPHILISPFTRCSGGTFAGGYIFAFGSGECGTPLQVYVLTSSGQLRINTNLPSCGVL